MATAAVAVYGIEMRGYQGRTPTFSVRATKVSLLGWAKRFLPGGVKKQDKIISLES